MTREGLFGTDGIRGLAGDGWLSPDASSAIGRAAGAVVRERASGAREHEHPLRAVTGHDGRRSGPELEAAISRGFVEAGFSVQSAGLVTTPGLATIARRFGFELAAMISASHNPARDNGIKFFGHGGTKIPDDIERAIETRFFRDPRPARDGPPPVLEPAFVRTYVDELVGAVPGLRLDGLALVIDGANGGGSRLAPEVFGRLGARTHAIACAPNGDNINDGCGATSTGALATEVLRTQSLVGIALDGDGDRCVLVDERGGEVTGDAILTICAVDLAERGKLARDRIVATVMSNRGLHRALRAKGVEVLTVGVGDRRVVEALRREGIELGGEQSGHIVFGAEHHFVGDGVYTALRVLDVVQRSGRPLSALASAYRPLPQVLVNARVERKPALEALAGVQQAVRSLERELGDDGRVLLRYSGTEPLARVMIEGPDEEWIRARAEELALLLVREIDGAA